MEFFKPGRVYNFMAQSPRWFLVSAIVCAISVLAWIYPGPNWGTDFSGGTELEVTFKKPVSDAQLRRALSSIGFREAEIVPVSGRRSAYIVRVKEVSRLGEAQAKAAERKIKSELRSSEPFLFRLSQGGDKLALQFAKDVDPAAIQRVLESARLEVRTVAPFGRPEDHRFEVHLVGVGDAMMKGLRDKLGAATVPADADRVEWVGPKAGEQLRDAGIRALIYSMLLMALYIAFRFDLRFAPGAILALIHDVLVALAAILITQREITLTTVAALLTIVGFSINDTIVIYDRIRENFSKMRERDLAKMVDVSVSETLGRTVNTTMTTLLAVTAILVFTSGTVQDFALTLFVGFVSGVYSSVFIASPITVWFDKHVFRRGQTA